MQNTLLHAQPDLRRFSCHQRPCLSLCSVWRPQCTHKTVGSQPRHGRSHGIQQESWPLACAAAKADTVVNTAAKPASSERQALALETQFWEWPGQGKRQTHRIAFVTHGSGPVPVVLIHGMGACHEHWNKLLAELDTRQYTAYALDLLGFGDSDKPLPARESGPEGHLYDYDTWSSQLLDFVEQVVGEPALLVGNSAGALAALQAAVEAPQLVLGLMLLDCSMRRMHERNQLAVMHPLITAFQWVLLRTPLGQWLVQSVLSQPTKLRSILQSAYGDPTCLSPELFQSWTRHLRDPTSSTVLLDVFTNSKGPIPKDLLPYNTVPLVAVWGAKDPWEPVERARSLFSGWCADFVVLPGVGHFPQDEVPAIITRMLDAFVEECMLDDSEAAGKAGAAAAGRCTKGSDGLIEGFTLKGLMAAAELDAKV